MPFFCDSILDKEKKQLKSKKPRSWSDTDDMPRRGDSCQYFNATLFRYYLRKKYKRSEAFANRIGVSRQAVDAWRNGDKKPTWKHAVKIAKVFNISLRKLLTKQGQHEFQLWQDHLIDYLMAPPELAHETKITIISDTGTHTEKKVERELKLTAKEAIEIAEKLGIFELDTESDDDTLSENPLHEILKD